MKKTTLYIGLNDQFTKTQLIPMMKARDYIVTALTENGVQGMTVYTATGMWKYEDGTMSTENTIIVEVMGFDIPATAIDTIKRELNQESVGISIQEIEVAFL